MGARGGSDAAITMKAICFEKIGGPEVLQWQDIELAAPAAGEVRIRHTAIGLNFIDTYHRSGLYSVPLPSGLGAEAAGIVEILGEGVSDFAVGDRVAYGTGPLGAYSEARNFAANRLVKLPPEISDDAAAGMMLKGMTVQYLLHSSFAVKSGDIILLHAAAGGVGLILSQWAKALGVTVIGVVGSAEKVDLAKSHGCDFVINSSVENIVARVKDITSCKGVPVVYDGVGQASLITSLDCLAPHGTLVSFGNASGPVKSLDLGLLAARGSLYVTRPTLGSFVSTDTDFKTVSNHVVNLVASGAIKIEIGQRYALRDAAQAHIDLEARKTTGVTVLRV
jgi:NADPH:quinone reductase